MIRPQEIVSNSVQETLALGRQIGESLVSGDVVALDGPLGAGKTHLAKGIAIGLGVPVDEPVVSPTFVLIREYVGRLMLYHIDAYRLASADELRAIGWDELRGANGVIVIEWADRVAELIPSHAVRVEMEHAGEAARRLRILPGNSSKSR